MWNYNQTPSGDELMHYGILGMKWGVRRYQNKNGSLTAAGKKRLKKTNQDDDNTSDDYKKARSKSTKEMSDVELQAAIKRLQMEKQYKDLNPPTVSRGKKVTEYVLKKAGNVALDASLNLAKDYAVKKAKDKLGLSEKKSAEDELVKELKKELANHALKKQRRSMMKDREDWAKEDAEKEAKKKEEE